MHKKHISSIRLYLEDLALMDRPWERWEFFFRGEWEDLQSEPGWRDDVIYRRKSDVIKVGNLEFPKPESAPPAVGETCFCPNTVDGNVFSWIWDDSGIDLLRLAKKVVHLTEEAAKAHINAILSLTQSN